MFLLSSLKIFHFLADIFKLGQYNFAVKGGKANNGELSVQDVCFIHFFCIPCLRASRPKITWWLSRYWLITQLNGIVK